MRDIIAAERKRTEADSKLPDQNVNALKSNPFVMSTMPAVVVIRTLSELSCFRHWKEAKKKERGKRRERMGGGEGVIRSLFTFLYCWFPFLFELICVFFAFEFVVFLLLLFKKGHWICNLFSFKQWLFFPRIDSCFHLKKSSDELIVYFISSLLLLPFSIRFYTCFRWVTIEI